MEEPVQRDPEELQLVSRDDCLPCDLDGAVDCVAGPLREHQRLGLLAGHRHLGGLGPLDGFAFKWWEVWASARAKRTQTALSERVPACDSSPVSLRSLVWELAWGGVIRPPPRSMAFG